MKNISIAFAFSVLTIFAAPLASTSGTLLGATTAHAEMMSISTGVIKGVGGNYIGEGNVNIVKDDSGKHILELSDFTSTAGPDLKVFLVEGSSLKDGNDVIAGNHVNLGVLKSTSGAQSYVLPEGVDPSNFGSVAIFCEKYTVLFSSADLK